MKFIRNSDFCNDADLQQAIGISHCYVLKIAIRVTEVEVFMESKTKGDKFWSQSVKIINIEKLWENKALAPTLSWPLTIDHIAQPWVSTQNCQIIVNAFIGNDQADWFHFTHISCNLHEWYHLELGPVASARRDQIHFFVNTTFAIRTNRNANLGQLNSYIWLAF